MTAAVKTVNLALPDVTLRLDMNGVIRDVSLANSLSSESTEGWLGRPWVDTVGDVGGDKIRRMVEDARVNGVSDFRQVTQRFANGLEVPMEYNTVRLGGNAGLLAVGRNLQAVAGVQSRLLAAQQAREQDAWKLREVETRYRLLFESSDDPILLLNTDGFRIIDANPAAIRAGALDAGRDFPAAVAPQDREAFRAVMARVRDQGRAPGILLHLGASPAPWMVRASLATTAPETVFLLQLQPVAATSVARREDASLEEMIERLPDGVVLVDLAGTVHRANRAFLDLVQTAALGSVIGQPIGRWLSRPGADAAVLLAQVSRNRVLRRFSTAIQGELGTSAEVEISVVGDSDAGPRRFLLLMHDVSRRLPPTEELGGDLGAGAPSATPRQRLVDALAGLTEQIGQVPLLKLVRDTGSLIERHYIEGALERAQGNRTAAAELLGLSRQSLYAKLGRYGLAGTAENKAAGD